MQKPNFLNCFHSSGGSGLDLPNKLKGKLTPRVGKRKGSEYLALIITALEWRLIVEVLLPLPHQLSLGVSSLITRITKTNLRTVETKTKDEGPPLLKS